jgi:tRNA(Ile2) C34 agmatinyltransferase TiaS
MPAIVAPKPICRHCGATMKRFRRCPKCGRWSLTSLLGSGGARH